MKDPMFLLIVLLMVLLPVDVLVCQWSSCGTATLTILLAIHGMCLLLAGVLFIAKQG